ncbi:single-stranded-DNA-specific exonuclease RecJ [Candidatus Woesebacteria bacterium RIFOXYB1_FULL_38_16]|uniref:Single-stranded-DNA-specific exonuclease RecJ n=1 Tax=Candidatus Woesebacteria bacterium RIFOXYB1_FULL_38_16 TaxID=1802538 RepID=A0A1F8CSI2_9BACT|nr:MAG: single-stranded-DNA-specific exonuclease RecJ [Candidatus Woesebacteria bacterium RIFOXYA1_FULL_38_9]OGM79026.1 MAG: single-stranded-DNA-specific exonuclease RecJ [Candidatus Woesebacteria bacterium RIFOXYB1_FULL_38_16]
MKDRKWEVLGKLGKGKNKVGDVLEVIFENRGLKSEKERGEFMNSFHPKDLDFHELGLKKSGILAAVKRIKLAKERGESVIVYGDYDADGICSTAVLWEALYVLGLNCLPFIPNRFNDGYGINLKSVEKILENNSDLKLIVTVDNGITANKEIEKIKTKGIDVIVSDHHQQGEKLPRVSAIVHSLKLCGSSVAWILARELYREFEKEKCIDNGLDLVAIGSIADQMSYVGVNRSFIKWGLLSLQQTSRVGLLALIKSMGVEREKISSYTVGFMIAPRLNATGRMDTALDSLRLVCAKNIKKVEELTINMNKKNQERQNAVLESLELINGKKRSVPQDLVFVSDRKLHEGIIGLLASNLAEKYFLPAVVVSVGEVYAKGSARSIPGVNIIKAIKELDKYLIAGGGHPMAAGFTIKTSDIKPFSLKLTKIIKSLLTPNLKVKKVLIDLEVGFDLIDWDLFSSLENLSPFGIDNPSPVFLTRDVEVLEFKKVGEGGKHLKLKVKHFGREYDAIGFGLGERNDLGDKIDIVYSLEKNTWNNRESLQLKIEDIRKSEEFLKSWDKEIYGERI